MASNSNDSTQAKQVDITVALIVLATFFVILRMLSRFKRRAGLGSDDVTLIVSLPFLYIIAGLNFGMIHHGMGRHQSTLSSDNAVIVFKQLVAFECFYVTTVALIKISLLLMYHRIFGGGTRLYLKISSYILGGIVIAWAIAIIFVSIFQCSPVRKAWYSTIPGTCIDLKSSFIGNGVPNIVTDVAILSLPAQHVWGLHANLVHRLSVIAMFALGFFVLFASIYRFSTLFGFDISDLTWTLATPCTWCVVECASGIIGACLPTIRPVLQMISTQFGSTNGSKGDALSRQEYSGHFRSTSKRIEEPSFKNGNVTSVAWAGSDDVSGRRIERDSMWASEDEVPLNDMRKK